MQNAGSFNALTGPMFFLSGLQLLQAHDVGLCFAQPAQQHRNPAIDPVDVESRDLFMLNAAFFAIWCDLQDPRQDHGTSDC